MQRNYLSILPRSFVGAHAQLNKESASAGVSDEQQGTKEGLQAENGDRNQ